MPSSATALSSSRATGSSATPATKLSHWLRGMRIRRARARRILIPLNQCDNLVAGVAELPVARLLESAVAELGKLLPPAGGAD